MNRWTAIVEAVLLVVGQIKDWLSKRKSRKKIRRKMKRTKVLGWFLLLSVHGCVNPPKPMQPNYATNAPISILPEPMARRVIWFPTTPPTCMVAP